MIKMSRDIRKCLGECGVPCVDSLVTNEHDALSYFASEAHVKGENPIYMVGVDRADISADRHIKGGEWTLTC